MGKFFRDLFCFCDRNGGREGRRVPLKISAPMDFRREDISIPGLDPEQQRFIREKAITDAERMWEHLQPLKSSPSTEFASRPPTFKAFTRPRPAGTRRSTDHRRSLSNHVPAAMRHIRAHSRKISTSLSKGYHAVGPGSGNGYSGTGVGMVTRPKTSGGESYSASSKSDFDKFDKDSVTEVFAGKF